MFKLFELIAEIMEAIDEGLKLKLVKRVKDFRVELGYTDGHEGLKQCKDDVDEIYDRCSDEYEVKEEISEMLIKDVNDSMDSSLNITSALSDILFGTSELDEDNKFEDEIESPVDSLVLLKVMGEALASVSKGTGWDVDDLIPMIRTSAYEALEEEVQACNCNED